MLEAMKATAWEVLAALKATGLANAPALTTDVVDLCAGAFVEAGLSPDDLRLAARRVAVTERFFPAPAVLIEKVRPKANDDAKIEFAWLSVRRCLERYGAQASLHVSDLNDDGHALWALERLGWERLGNSMGEGMGANGSDNRPLFRAEFARLYQAARQFNQSLSYLPGRFERENGGANVTLSPRLVGRPDWRELPERGVVRETTTEELLRIDCFLAAAVEQVSSEPIFRTDDEGDE